MTEEQLRVVENRALSVDEAVLSEAAEYYNSAGAAEVDFADNAPQDVLALVKEVRAQRQRAEAAEAELAVIPYRQLYDVWHSGDEGYTIRDADDVAVWLAKWKLKQPA